ncbi:DNA methyltransferase [Thiohalobacter thiocyanaticus]|uniref:DNA methyltransferase n=1 Tax=Thiohalobacter thiocyanaticus TaxID=585455 RepID=UPI00131A1784|nr:DNA methyltransferase [Thiohalobacter thiocyanaticus]
MTEIDWDFSGDHCASSFSKVHWHPCRFVAQIPATLIGLLTDPGDTVLDPFCGSGTAIVEAQRLGRIATGIDINPVAGLVAKSKLHPVDGMTVAAAASRWKRHTLKKIRLATLDASEAMSAIPQGVQQNKWYSESTLRDLAVLWDAVRASRGEYADIWRAAFSAILLGACNEDRHWGYVCDNTQPKAVRRIDAVDLYMQAVDAYVAAYIDRDEFLGKGVEFPLPQADVIQDDAADAMEKLCSNSIDLVITSPPYFGVCDYIKAQRLSLEWFDMDIEEFRLREIGARSKRHRKSAVSDYLFEMVRVFREVYRLLRGDGYLALIIGESSHRQSVVDELTSVICDIGFEVLVEKERQVPVQRRQHPSLREESVIIARK